ncbi:MAG: hypothetical protein ABIJ45_06185 [Candidatus Zixiibacteriota bacterium]
MGVCKKDKKNGTKIESGPKNEAVNLIKEGDLCPNCQFAKLIREPGNIIKCPVCGFGNGAGCT